jgi:hypothetical protein
MLATADVYDGKYSFRDKFCAHAAEMLHVCNGSMKIVCVAISIIM